MESVTLQLGMLLIRGTSHKQVTKDTYRTPLQLGILNLRR